MAVSTIASQCDAIVVIGGAHSANSRRLLEMARIAGCPKAVLVETAGGLDASFLEGVATLGVTSGASTPEVLVQELIDDAPRATAFLCL
jgi:4-hydroxy-3-methylbut-2-enyl diphosphate reductase